MPTTHAEKTEKTIDTVPTVDATPPAAVPKSKTITLKLNTNVITTLVLVVLVIISVSQAFELSNLKKAIAGGEVQAATTSATSTGSAANLNDLPEMVGGC